MVLLVESKLNLELEDTVKKVLQFQVLQEVKKCFRR